MPKNYVHLGPTDILVDRPFTDPLASFEDITVMEYLFGQLRTFVLEPTNVPDWPRPFLYRLTEADGCYHRVVIVRRSKLLLCENLTVVGFFGQKRPYADCNPVEAVDKQLIAEFLQFPDLLTYTTYQKLDGQYCNLVLFSQLQGLVHWASGTTHAQAVALSPAYYNCIRLHTTFLPGGLMSNKGLTLYRTKYFSYDEDFVWAAVREFEPPLI